MKPQRAIYGLSWVMLCGCISFPNYPPNWAPLESARPDCVSIGGVYHNAGGGSRFGGPHLAPRVFFETKDRALFEGTDRVAIAVTSNGKLEVTAFSQDRPLRIKQYFADKDEYRCDNGKIRMAHFTSLFGLARESVILSKSTDGALVVEDGAVGALFLLIPVAGFEWLRFEPYASGKPKPEPQPIDDFVNCVAGGERRWTDRSKCD